MSPTPCRLRTAAVNPNALALVTIVFLLGSMLPPALAQVIGGADRQRCLNNLRQIALACMSYETDHGTLPTSGKGTANPDMADAGSWCYRLTPYLDQKNIFLASGGKNAAAIFYSPTRRKSALYNDQPKTDYAGNVGTADDPEKHGNDGAFTTTGVRRTDFQDGAATTLLIGVKGLKIGDYVTGRGAGDAGSCWTGGTTDTLRSTDEGKRIPVKDANADNARGFGSPLMAACNFAFADGSVRPVKLTVAANVFKALSTRAGGEVVNPADF